MREGNIFSAHRLAATVMVALFASSAMGCGDIVMKDKDASGDTGIDGGLATTCVYREADQCDDGKSCTVVVVLQPLYLMRWSSSDPGPQLGTFLVGCGRRVDLDS